MLVRFAGRCAGGKIYAIDEIEDYSHSNAKLFEVKAAIIVDVSKVPHPFQLIISQLAVFEHGGCLGSAEMGAAIGKRGEDFPVSFDFPLLDFLI